MIVINVDNLDTLIKKNNIYNKSVLSNQKKLINSINDLSTCYVGNSLEFLFNEPKREIKNIESISNTIESYSDVLYSVKISYQKQDVHLKNQTSHRSSNL